jgi:hypothetical protein
MIQELFGQTLKLIFPLGIIADAIAAAGKRRR